MTFTCPQEDLELHMCSVHILSAYEHVRHAHFSSTSPELEGYLSVHNLLKRKNKHMVANKRTLLVSL